MADDDDIWFTPPIPDVVRKMKCLDESEYQSLMENVEKVRSNPFMWWVREKRFNCTIQADVAVTFEFLQEADALGKDEILHLISDKIAQDIMAAYRKRNTELFGTPDRILDIKNQY